MENKAENRSESKSDINIDNWIFKIIPKSLHPYALLGRIDRPIGIWLLFLPASWSIILASKDSDDNHYIILLILFFIGSILMRSAGCVINDILDRNIDKKVERTKNRPLASGSLTIKNAIFFLFILLSISAIILLNLNNTTIILGLCSLILVALYPLMKRLTWWPQAFLGITFNFGALMGWSAVTNDISLIPILLYIAGILWTLGYDTIYAFQDKNDDELIGVRSTARLLDLNAKYWLSSFYSIIIIILLIIGLMSSVNYLFYLFIIAISSHMIWQIIYWDINSPRKSLTIFKSNRDLGILITIGLFLGTTI